MVNILLFYTPCLIPFSTGRKKYYQNPKNMKQMQINDRINIWPNTIKTWKYHFSIWHLCALIAKYTKAQHHIFSLSVSINGFAFFSQTSLLLYMFFFFFLSNSIINSGTQLTQILEYCLYNLLAYTVNSRYRKLY